MTIVEGESLVNDGTGLVAYGSPSWRSSPGRTRRSRPAGCSCSASSAASPSAWRWGGSCASSGGGSTTPRGDHDLAPHGVPRVHPRRASRRLGRARRGDGGHLPRLAHARADDAAGAPPDVRRVGDRPVPPERAPLRAGRASAPGRRGRAGGHLRGSAARVLGARQRHGRRGAVRVGVRRPAGAEVARRPHVELARRRLPVVGGDARRGVARGGARAPAPDRRRASRSPDATSSSSSPSPSSSSPSSRWA